jgi:GrpB-like predicted nucleotidyltransferase (UPF0157 family)
VVLSGGINWQRYLLFRDRLRGDSGLRNSYALLKKNLAVALPSDRKTYGEGKKGFIEKVLEQVSKNRS